MVTGTMTTMQGVTEANLAAEATALWMAADVAVDVAADVAAEPAMAMAVAERGATLALAMVADEVAEEGAEEMAQAEVTAMVAEEWNAEAMTKPKASTRGGAAAVAAGRGRMMRG